MVMMTSIMMMMMVKKSKCNNKTSKRRPDSLNLLIKITNYKIMVMVLRKNIIIKTQSWMNNNRSKHKFSIKSNKSIIKQTKMLRAMKLKKTTMQTMISSLIKLNLLLLPNNLIKQLKKIIRRNRIMLLQGKL